MLYMIIRDTSFYENSAVIKAGSDFAQGLACGMLLTGITILLTGQSYEGGFFYVDLLTKRKNECKQSYKKEPEGQQMFKRKMLDNKK